MIPRDTTIIRRAFFLTADDAPIYVVASRWLDAWQRIVGGVRGYGGPIPGHWLKLTRSQFGDYDRRQPTTLAKELNDYATHR